VTHSSSGGLPSRHAALEQLVAAEHGDGWMAQCVDAMCHQVLTRELVDALTAILRPMTRVHGPVLEVCAGDGSLAAALRQEGIAIVATDAAPPAHAVDVACLSAAEALATFDPAIVLGAFVPFDSTVDAAVMRHERARHYLVLNARTGGALGAGYLWTSPRWRPRPLRAVTTNMISRHDVWLGDGSRVRGHGEAWLFSRATTSLHAAHAANRSTSSR
jgi:hypothetical protein